MSAEDRDVVLARAYEHWTSKRDGDDITASEPITAQMFRGAA